MVVGIDLMDGLIFHFVRGQFNNLTIRSYICRSHFVGGQFNN